MPDTSSTSSRPPAPRRRLIRSACVFLALGLLATIASAWAAAMFSPLAFITFADPNTTYDPDTDLISISHSLGPIEFPSSNISSRGFGWNWITHSDMHAWSDGLTNPPGPSFYAPREGRPNRVIRVLVSGWPCRALIHTSEWSISLTDREPPPPLTGLAALWREGIQVRPSSPTPLYLPERTHLPLRPLPLGFLINTLFYAALFAATRSTFTAFRRHRRTRRGLCPRCAYPSPLHASSAPPHQQPTHTPPPHPRRCPECGYMVKFRS